MRNFKKFLTLVLAVMMVVSAMAVSTSAATFEDVTAEDEYLADGCLKYVGKTASFLPVETNDKMDRGSLYTAKVVNVNNGKLEVKIL